MARRALIACLCALVLAAPASAGSSAASWALPQIKLVTAHGLMGGKASGFRPEDALTAGDLGDLVAGLTGQEAPMAADPSAPVTIAQLDAQLVARARACLPRPVSSPHRSAQPASRRRGTSARKSPRA